MFTQDVPPEVALARFRRRSWVILAVAAVSFVIAEAMEPAPFTFLAVSALAGIGVVEGAAWIEGYKQSTREHSWEFVFIVIFFMVGENIVQDSWMRLRETESLIELWSGFSVMTGTMAATHLFRAREVVERRQQWWREHGPELTRGLNPNPVTLRERWRYRRQLDARMTGWELYVIIALIGLALILVAGAGLSYGRSGFAIPLGMGVVLIAWCVNEIRLARRDTG